MDGIVVSAGLLFHRVPPAVTVGSDLAYAAAARSLGVRLPHQGHALDWRAAGPLMPGTRAGTRPGLRLHECIMRTVLRAIGMRFLPTWLQRPLTPGPARAAPATAG